MSKLIMIAMLMCCFGCSALKNEAPQDAARIISKLLQKRDYSILFQERYSEWYKVEAEGVEPEAAIKRLSGMFEKQHDTMIMVFEQLSEADFTMGKSEMPQKTETGDMATATISINGKDMPYSLYKMQNGRWGFHL